jgi:hypothetical protein
MESRTFAVASDEALVDLINLRVPGRYAVDPQNIGQVELEAGRRSISVGRYPMSVKDASQV